MVKKKKKIKVDPRLSTNTDFIDALPKREQRRLKKEAEALKKLEQTQAQLKFQRQKEELAKKLATEEQKEIKVQQPRTRTNIYHRPVPATNKQLEKSKKEKSWGTNLFLTLVVLCAIAFLGYSIYIAPNKVDAVFTIVNASMITLTIILFALAGWFKNTKARKVTIIMTGFSFIALLGLHVGTSLEFFQLPTQPVVEDLTSKTMNQAMKWAAENKVNLSETKEYSETVKENHIMSQNIEPETLLKDVKEIEVITSEGPNPESSVELQDMIGWDVDTVVKEIKKLKLSKVDIQFEFSTIERDTLFEQSKTGKIHRNEDLSLKFSLGNEEDLMPVELINLIKKDEFDATLWLKRNGIKYEIKYEFSDKIKKGKVISTTPEKGTVIDQKTQSVTLVISKGPKIIVPDLMNMNLEEIAEWAIKYNVNISYNSEYDSKVKKGKIKAVSHKKGDVIEEGGIIYITTSKGTLRMIDYTEDDINKIRTFANTYKITLNEQSEYSDTVEKGKIISISHKKGDIVNTGDSIDVVISLGKSLVVPDFTGMSLSNAKNICSEKGFDCSVTYVKSYEDKNIVTGQNKRAGSEVIAGTNIVLYVSNGQAPSNNPSSSDNNTPSWGGGSGGGSAPTTPSQPDPPSCTSNQKHQLIIQPNWIQGGSYSSTISTLQKYLPAKYPNVTFVFTHKAGNERPGFIHVDSPYTNGSTITDCTTVTIIINE